MLKWTQPLAGIKDHSNTSAKMMNAYDADYKKRCVFRGANFHRSKRLKWLLNRLVNLDVDLKLAMNEASHERVTALEIEIDGMKADINVLESQTAEQRVAAASERDAKWTVEVDASIESMIKNSVSFAKIASKLGNGLSRNDHTQVV